MFNLSFHLDYWNNFLLCPPLLCQQVQESTRLVSLKMALMLLFCFKWTKKLISSSSQRMLVLPQAGTNTLLLSFSICSPVSIYTSLLSFLHIHWTLLFPSWYYPSFWNAPQSLRVQCPLIILRSSYMSLNSSSKK